ncbi:NAD(P)-dependent oxidoreductase [Streptomyces sp. NPDC005393]|uniref:NAD(P)-dependent oxidoreductase n=1 Tax=Streptomyces sp. NPDC005393 TaxID=3157041 RepID=UPI0033B72E8D
MSNILVIRGAADIGTLRAHAPDAHIQEVDRLQALSAIEATSILLLRSGVYLGEQELKTLPSLRHVIRPGSGMDNIDVEALGRRGIVVHRNPEASAPAVAEWVLASALMLSRRMPLGHATLTDGVHDKAACMGTSLANLAVGVWGAGPVGLAAARALAPHVARIAHAHWPSNPHGLSQSPPHELAQQAQVHVIALPLRPATRHLVGPGFLKSVRPQRPLLICTGRLETLDVAACLRALEAGTISGLAIDGVERQHLPMLESLRKPMNLLVSPHIGAQRTDVRAALDRWAAELVKEIILEDQAAPVGERR